MALTNDQITALNFKDFYNQIRPYLNGDAHDAFIPIGSIISIMGNEAPLNFLICDGTTYNIADYTQLASYFTAQFGSANYFGGDGTTIFAVPDLQGEFLRGAGPNSHTGNGNGGDPGEHQDGTVQTVVNRSNNTNAAYLSNQNTENGLPANYDTVSSNDGQGRLQLSGTSQSFSDYALYTSRPTNTSVLYCIAYKNVYADMSGLAEAGDGINIDNGVVSVDEMPSSDMAEVASPMPSVMSRRMKYSTEEQIVGEWIDGKLIYQKTVDCGVLTASGTKTIAHNIADIGFVVDMKTIYYSDAYGSYRPYFIDDANIIYQVKIEVTATNVKLICRSFGDANKWKCYATILYTKTTD